ncbi:MAG: PIN domain-containing protein [Nitrospirae bacterium]|nr:PIN domain-containing protein [Nitrospirota bacterium]
MPTVIIDTDIAIDYLRGVDYAKTLVDPLLDTNNAFISVLSVYELHAGLREEERVNTNYFISACAVELVTHDVAIKGGSLYRHYREKGVTLAAIDCLIAATALIKGHKIATRNTAHYPEKGLLIHIGTKH